LKLAQLLKTHLIPSPDFLTICPEFRATARQQ